MHDHHPAVCSIIPPHILRKLSESSDSTVRDNAQRSMEISAMLRGERSAIGPLLGFLAVPAGQKRRTVYDAHGTRKLPGTLVRGEGGPATGDKAVNEAYDGSGDTYDFYQQLFQRNSVDGRGLRLDSTVHYAAKYDNAMWNGRQMVYGDGDGVIFNRFTCCLDVIGHELTHGVTQYTAGLEYSGQPGALNESFSDVMGILVKQWKNKQTAAQSDWLIGAGLLAKGIKGVALRSMKAPGTAYADPRLGNDPQPATMKDYVETEDDNGGVHINSGIPNHAFYNVAITLGGYAWEKAGRIWYATLTRKLSPSATFQECADATFEAAGELFGVGKGEQIAVRQGWQAVGITISSHILAGGPLLTLKDPAPRVPAPVPVAAYQTRVRRTQKPKR